MVKDEVTPCYIINSAHWHLPDCLTKSVIVPVCPSILTVRKASVYAIGCSRQCLVLSSPCFYSRLRISSMLLTSFLRENALMLYFKLTEKIRLSALFVSTDLRLA